MLCYYAKRFLSVEPPVKAHSCFPSCPGISIRKKENSVFSPTGNHSNPDLGLRNGPFPFRKTDCCLTVVFFLETLFFALYLTPAIWDSVFLVFLTCFQCIQPNYCAWRTEICRKLNFGEADFQAERTMRRGFLQKHSLNVPIWTESSSFTHTEVRTWCNTEHPA